VAFSEILGDDIRSDRDLRRWFKGMFKRIPLEDVYTVAIAHSLNTPVPDRLFDHNVLAGPIKQHGKYHIVLGASVRTPKQYTVGDVADADHQAMHFDQDPNEPINTRAKRTLRHAQRATFAKVKSMLQRNKRR